MQKILLDKKIKISEVLKKIETHPEKELVLIIPKNSNFDKNDFTALKETSQVLNKTIIIESIDEKILSLAEESGFEAVHPLFSPNSKVLTDIKKPEEEQKIHKHSEKDESPTKTDFEKNLKEQKLEPKFFYQNFEKDLEEDLRDEKPKHHHKKNHKKFLLFKPKFWLYAGLILIFGFAFWKISLFFSSAEINLKFKKTPFDFNNVVLGSKNSSNLDINKKIIPVELFINKQNLTEPFKATGQKNVSEKAQGEITIYNAYSSEPQVLVATTRFEAPNGLIYRLKDRIIVPGAQIKDGKIIPSSITALVEADQPGEKYNTGPISKLTL
ncbi:MAG: hypothetical protein ACP5QN_02140, partial [Minisyncoccia bacterium]